jgi:hypothetical protein
MTADLPGPLGGSELKHFRSLDGAIISNHFWDVVVAISNRCAQGCAPRVSSSHT